MAWLAESLLHPYSLHDALSLKNLLRVFMCILQCVKCETQGAGSTLYFVRLHALFLDSVVGPYSVAGLVIHPVYSGSMVLTYSQLPLPSGDGIAQVVEHQTRNPTE